MAYFDIRPSEDFRHLELRICDSCPELDNVELIAALFRTLVLRTVDDIAAGVPDPDLASTLIQAARWRAARFGLEGELSDLSTFTSRPAHDVVRDLVGKLEPQLGRTGDLDTVRELLGRVLHVGSSASRQRRALNRRGRLVDVVDDLIGLTRGRLRAPVAEPELDDDGGPRGYRRVALSAGGTPMTRRWTTTVRRGPRCAACSRSSRTWGRPSCAGGIRRWNVRRPSTA